MCRGVSPAGIPRMAFRFHPIHLLLAMVVFELILIALGLTLLMLGFQSAVPSVPMVTNVQLPDVAGDGS
jgi:sterol desaturase/sphingolipid hydroxylase (fatty acid hydroxylase superfamily)